MPSSYSFLTEKCLLHLEKSLLPSTYCCQSHLCKHFTIYSLSKALQKDQDTSSTTYKKKVLLSQRNTFQTKFRRMPCWRPYFFFRTFICSLQDSPSRAKTKLYSWPGAWKRSSSIGLTHRPPYNRPMWNRHCPYPSQYNSLYERTGLPL
jgi:hypothetical protein